MRKRSGILVLALTMLLCALCLPAAAAQQSFSVGYAETSIRPSNWTSFGLCGYGDGSTRKPTALDNYDIKATCIAVTDPSNNTVLFISVDLIHAYYYLVEHARDEITSRTGIPEENIMITASHTHSSFEITEVANTAANRQKYAAELEYRDVFLVDKLADLSQAALADRAQATMSIGEVEVDESNGYEEMNFVKHSWAQKANGEIIAMGDNFNDRSGVDYQTLLDRTTEADHTLQLVKFTRTGSKKPVVMVKWTAHPCLVGSVNRSTTATIGGKRVNMYTMLSPDYVGSLRDTLYKAGYLPSFFQGGAGNVNAYSRYSGESTKYKGYDNYVSYGVTLGTIAKNALESSAMKQVSAGPIQVSTDPYMATLINYGTDTALYNSAVAVHNEFYRLLNQGVANLTARHQALSKDTTGGRIHSVYHASTIKSVVENRDPNKTTQRMILNTVSIGDHFSMITSPGEAYDILYTQLQQRLSAVCPDRMIFTAAYSNSKVGYIPARYAYSADFGGSVAGYEDILSSPTKPYASYESDITSFVAGTGEEMVNRLYAMIMDHISLSQLTYCECGGTLADSSKTTDHICSNVAWLPWMSTDSLPTTSGNYYLTGNVTLKSEQYIVPGSVIRLDLNGKTVTQTATGDVCIYSTYEWNEAAGVRTLVLTDSQGGGKLIGSPGEVHQGGVIWAEVADLRMYGGTIDARTCVSKHRNGGAAIYLSPSRSFKMYGGTILGGTAIGVNQSNYPGNPSEGGAVALAGTMHMYGGSIQGGISDYGGGIYVASTGKLTVYNDASVTANFGNTLKSVDNNVYLADGAGLTVDGSYAGTVGITMATWQKGQAFASTNGYTLSRGKILPDQRTDLEATLSSGKLIWSGKTSGNKGDVDGNGMINTSDLELLLMYTLYPTDYPVGNNADVTADGSIDIQDLEYLLMHILYPDDYPV